MKDDRPAVDARLNVDLDGEAALDRLVNRNERVFRTNVVVKSAMGDGNGNKPGWGRHRANLAHRLPSLVASELLDSAGMPTALKGRRQPDIDNSQCHLD